MYPDIRSNAAVLEPTADLLWDYEVRSIHARHDSNLQEELKKYGREGWELVHVNIPVGNEYHCIFRKPVR
jgi:hypothetical protein